MSTVSRVLNGSSSVRVEIRQAVERLLKESNYQKRSISSPKKYMSGTIGLVVPDIANPYFTLLIKGIENTVRLFRLSLVLCDSENDTRLEDQIVANLLRAGISGLVLVPARTGGDSLIHHLVEREFPVVFLDRTPKRNHRISSVTADNSAGAYQAARYLISLGHRNILYLAGSTESSTEIARRDGFEKAIAEQKLKSDDLLHADGDYDWDRAYAEVTALLDARRSFSAVFATNDIMALGAMQALQEHDLKVPEHTSVIGFDDIPFSKLVSLTTVAQHPYEMATRAARLLLDIIEKRVPGPQSLVLMPSLMIRGSCRRL